MARVHVAALRMIAAAALVLPARAAAAPPTVATADPSRGAIRLRLDGTACTALRLDDVLPFAEVEVGHRLVEARPEDDDPILVRCSGDLVTIFATSADKGPRSYRTNLARTPASIRPRVVAIAIAEVVHDLEVGPSRRLRPANREGPPERPERALEVPVPTAPPMTATELGVFSQANRFQLDGRWLVGGGIRFDYLQPAWSLGLDAGLVGSDERAELGTVRTIVAYMSPYGAARWTHGPLGLRAGAGYAFGVGQVAGTSNRAGVLPDKITGPWASPYALFAVALTVSDVVTIDARGLAGWVQVPVVGRVEGGSDVALKGFWTSVQLGVAFAL